MTRLFATLSVLVGLTALPLLTGCDHTVKSSTSTVESSDGSVTQKETKVVRQPDGTIVTTEHKASTP